MYFFPYLLFFLFLILQAFLSRCYVLDNLGNRKLVFKQVAGFAFLSFVILFISFRAYVGGDWINYKTVFDYTPTFFRPSDKIINYLVALDFEPGLKIIYIITKSIYDNYLFFQCLLSVLDILILYKIFKEYFNNFWALCFISFFVFGGMTFSVIYERNFQAFILFILSIPSLANKNYKKYILYNFTGFLFHSSAIIYILLGFFLRRKYNRNTLLLIVLIGFMIRILGIPIMHLVLSVISKFFVGRLKVMLNAYLSISQYNSNYSLRLGDIERIFSFLLVYKYSYRINGEKKIRIMENCFYLYILIYLYGFDMAIIVGRVSQLFIFSYWFLYPAIFLSFTKKDSKIFIILFFVLYGGLKVSQGTNFPLWYYDNFLFNYLSTEERLRFYKNNPSPSDV